MGLRPDTHLLHAAGAEQQELHARAAHAAVQWFGRRVFVRGVVEISNYCREDCAYCGMRRSNRELSRYRARADQLAEALLAHRPPSMTDVNLQAGEDPVAVREVALPLIRHLRRETSWGIIVCLGTLEPALYDELRDAGASVYILKFEVADAHLYERFRAPGSLAERIHHLRWLADHGWYVSSGLIAGLPGQTEAQLLAAFDLAAALPLHGCSVSPFIPGGDTPLAEAAAAPLGLTLNCMALLRLMRPDWTIPAVSALNLAEPTDGYRRGLRTGANLVTMNLTPPLLRDNYVLYRRHRLIMTEERILAALEAEGLTPATQSLVDSYRAPATTAPTSAGARRAGDEPDHRCEESLSSGQPPNPRPAA